MKDNEHLSAEWVEQNLYRFPWYCPYFDKKIKKIELRSFGFQYEEEVEDQE